MSKTSFKTIPFYILIFLLIAFFFRANLRTDFAYDTGLGEEVVAEQPPVMVPYEGEILNIFFHPVIARPKIAFSGNWRDGFINWFVTADEYKRILYEFYIQDYILVNIDEFYKITYLDGIKTITKQTPLVPEGKKALVLSIDDLNYYDYMRENGVVHKLVIDENNEIAAWTDTEDGGELSYDLDIVTITEGFIKEHPDFSLRGAKGIIALTGYEGALGYRSQSWEWNPGYEEERAKAKVVATRMKELGWRFASHSFTHWNMQTTTLRRFIYDANIWDMEIRPVVGDTDMYIYPFGDGVEDDEERHKILRDHGFNLFFSVGLGYKFVIAGEYIYLERRNIDGVYFHIYRKKDDKLFDIEKVMDKEARGIKN